MKARIALAALVCAVLGGSWLWADSRLKTWLYGWPTSEASLICSMS